MSEKLNIPEPHEETVEAKDLSAMTKEELEGLCRSLLNRLKDAIPQVEADVPQEEVAPQVEEAAPQVEEAAPQVEEAAPHVKETAPQVEEAAAHVEEDAPHVEEAAPLVEEAAPLVEEAALDLEETAPQAPEVCDVSPSASTSLNPSTIAELVQKKEANELRQEDLFSMFLLTAQETLTHSQKIVDLEKRLEEAESRIDKIEVVTGETASIADTIPEAPLPGDLEGMDQLEVAMTDEVPETLEVFAEVRVDMEEVVEGTPKIDDSPTEVADNPAEALASPPETDDSPVESRDSPGEAGDSPVEAADSLDEAEDSPAQVADSPAEEEDITTQIELAEKSNTRVTRKRTKVTFCQFLHTYIDKFYNM